MVFRVIQWHWTYKDSIKNGTNYCTHGHKYSLLVIRYHFRALFLFGHLFCSLKDLRLLNIKYSFPNLIAEIILADEMRKLEWVTVCSCSAMPPLMEIFDSRKPML